MQCNLKPTNTCTSCCPFPTQYTFRSKHMKATTRFCRRRAWRTWRHRRRRRRRPSRRGQRFRHADIHMAFSTARKRATLKEPFSLVSCPISIHLSQTPEEAAWWSRQAVEGISREQVQGFMRENGVVTDSQARQGIAAFILCLCVPLHSPWGATFCSLRLPLLSHPFFLNPSPKTTI